MSDGLSYPVPDGEPLVPLIRDLTRCFQVVAGFGTRDIQSHGLDPQEFDVLVVLGDSSGKTCKTIANEVMITSPTLSRVLSRLEAKGWLEGHAGSDARQKITSLTAAGQAAYERAFLPHIRAMRQRLNQLSTEEQAELSRLLTKMTAAFAVDAGALPQEEDCHVR